MFWALIFIEEATVVARNENSENPAATIQLSEEKKKKLIF